MTSIERGKFLNLTLIVIFALSAVYLFSMVSAIHVVRTSTGTTTQSILEDTQSILNISVNNTDTLLTGNITQVNISLPSGVVFVTGTNLSTSLSSFVNTSSVLSWTNATASMVMNLTTQFFSFNVTVATPGNYNVSVLTLNVTGTFFSNITLTVNDTTVPSSVSFQGQTNSTGTNLSSSSIVVNVSATDNGIIGNIVLNLFNATGLVNRSTSGSAVSTYYQIFTNLPDGIYFINSTVNDTFSNSNSSSTITLRLDTTAPAPSPSCSPSTVDRDSTVTCSCSASDSGSGVASTSIESSPSTQETGTFSVTCSALDYAGNSGSADTEYTVEGSGAYRGSSGSGSSSNSQTTWTSTYEHDDSEISSDGFERSLGSGQRVSIRVSGETHYVGVKSTSSTSASIEISSTPQSAILNVGDTKMFNLDSDGYYDLSVTLISIDSGKANLSLKPVHEQISSDSQQSQDDSASLSPESQSSNIIWWILGTLVLVAVVVVVIMRSSKKK